MPLQHLRTSTANKRPVPGNMSEGQLALNSNNGSPGLFFRDNNSNLVKVGPVHVGTTAPNASPAVGGTAGNSVGEQWLDTTGGTYVFKVWDGSAWRSESGTFVDVNGDVMTGALGIIAGSAAAPGLYFSGDTNTGLYSPGSDQLALATGGTGRLFVDASGNVSIGSSGSPYAAANRGVLEVNGTNQALYGFKVNTSGVGYLLHTGTDLVTANTVAAGAVTFSTNGAERARITSAGLVGVGTSSPGTVGGGATLNIDAAGGARVVLSSASRRFYITGASGSDDLRIGRRISIDTADSDIVTIAGGGNVGIGTTGPGTALDVVGAIRSQNGTIDARLQAGYAGAVGIGAQSNDAVLFIQNATERARIDSSGRLLVGTSSSLSAGNWSDSLIQIRGNSSGSGFEGKLALFTGRTIAAGIGAGENLGRVAFGNGEGGEAAWITAQADAGWSSNDYPGRIVFSTTADGASSSAERVRITSTGQVRLAGAGITFNGDTATANELDDYEEGTFTPTIVGTTSAGTGTYTNQIGRYTKIGDRVTFTVYLNWTAHTGTGNIRISNLPFTSTSATGSFHAASIYADGIPFTGPWLQAYVGVNSTNIGMGQMTAAGVVTGIPMDAAGDLTITGHYEV